MQPLNLRAVVTFIHFYLQRWGPGFRFRILSLRSLGSIGHQDWAEMLRTDSQVDHDGVRVQMRVQMRVLVTKALVPPTLQMTAAPNSWAW